MGVSRLLIFEITALVSALFTYRRADYLDEANPHLIPLEVLVITASAYIQMKVVESCQLKSQGKIFIKYWEFFHLEYIWKYYLKVINRDITVRSIGSRCKHVDLKRFLKVFRGQCPENINPFISLWSHLMENLDQLFTPTASLRIKNQNQAGML
jgi:hypothetical protein